MTNVKKTNIIDLGVEAISALYRWSAPYGKGKDKVKFTLEQTTKTQGVIRNIALLFF